MNRIVIAYNLIEEGEYSEAQKIGNILILEGELEGYFILADIAHEKEDIETCISILKSGIEEYRGNWRLWMRLGNYQSDLEQFEDAEYSYDRALFMNNADQSIIKINKAILFSRQKLFDQAKILVEDCRDDYPIKSFCLELDILNELEQYEQIILKFEEQLFDDDYEHDFDAFSEALFFVANAYYHQKNKILAKQYLKDSLDLNRDNENSQWLRRELFGKSNSKNKYWQIMINGDYEDIETKGEEMEFFTWYNVVSLSIEDALEEIKEFEPTKLNKNSFRIEEYEMLEERTSVPSGIYETCRFHICQKE